MNTPELSVKELSCNDLSEINGGFVIEITTAVVLAAVAVVAGSYSAGEKIGEAIYYATH